MVRRADVLIDSVYTNITNSSENNVDARYYYVIDNNDSSMPQVNNVNDRIVKPKEAVKTYRTVLQNNKNTGFYSGYRYRLITEDNRNIAIFIQRIGMIDEVKKNAYTLGTISVVGVCVIFIFLIAISKYMVMPIANAYKKQKEFITSASHELKTPITVILADNVFKELFARISYLIDKKIKLLLDNGKDVLIVEHGAMNCSMIERNSVKGLKKLPKNYVVVKLD